MAIHNHTTPQEYLKHFAPSDEPGKVWRYSLHEGKWELLAVGSVGQRKDFYTPEDELRLSKIEQSAIGPFNLLRSRRQPDQEGREAVAAYLTTMIVRVEHARKKLPGYLGEQISHVRMDTASWARHWKVSHSLLLKLLGEKEQSLHEDPLRTRDPILREVGEFPVLTNHIMGMHWRVFTARLPDRFLTSDNPVFIGADTGLQPPLGKFLFALASEVALVGSWQGLSGGLEFLMGSSRFVRDFNRHVISGADRWLYFREKAGWVPKAVKNPSTKIGRTPW